MTKPAQKKAAFVFEEVKHCYSGVPALEKIDLKINEGEKIAIVGPSGSGKSTFLNIINASIQPTHGKIKIFGKDSHLYSPKELKTLRSNISLIPQNLALVNSFRVWQNVITGGIGHYGFLKLIKNLFAPSKNKLADIHSILERVGIEEKLYSITSTLSGGQKQRVAVARSIFQSPSTILADEPVSSVDPARAASLVKILLKVAEEEEATLLMSLHNLDLAMRHFPRIIGIRNGNVHFDQSPDQISQSQLEELYELKESEILQDG
tara:strand:- start:351 stop:1142 length:792 start_codon:yes stop_codon:yes gene_type:complete